MHTPTDINDYDYGQFYSNIEICFLDATRNRSYRFIYLNSFSVQHS